MLIDESDTGCFQLLGDPVFPKDLLPGDLITHSCDDQAMGTVVGEGTVGTLVLWSVAPSATARHVGAMSLQIRDEIDNEILRDMDAIAEREGEARCADHE